MTGRAEGVRLRIATLNVWGKGDRWPERRGVLKAEFAHMDADLVALQETIVAPEGPADTTLDQARDVLGPEYHLVHSATREPNGQGITTASRWPVGRVVELDLRVTPRTHDFACTALLIEVLVPEPIGRVWMLHHFPDYQLDHEHERTLQALVVARAVEDVLTEQPGHVVLAGDLDAEPQADSLRFLTGHHGVDGMSVCYRDAWTSTHGHADRPDGDTFVPANPNGSDWDWPYRRIDYILVRCGAHGGPTLRVMNCARTFDQPHTTISDHYGLVADLAPPPERH
ncbi:endonuclease/exonuclease/phosphatase family protein [Paractinoplanes maris]|uniref:endonuclease/exonuclease/phosphatase family protein n=1 Tax=Paractinoplanes maris TaxID=1734446 RepID=UPI00202026D1|nr:endonuclease/exonuclease/phosphatase family protein [Actinoplanes maris]